MEILNWKLFIQLNGLKLNKSHFYVRTQYRRPHRNEALLLLLVYFIIRINIGKSCRRIKRKFNEANFIMDFMKCIWWYMYIRVANVLLGMATYRCISSIHIVLYWISLSIICARVCVFTWIQNYANSYWTTTAPFSSRVRTCFQIKLNRYAMRRYCIRLALRNCQIKQIKYDCSIWIQIECPFWQYSACNVEVVWNYGRHSIVLHLLTTLEKLYNFPKWKTITKRIASIWCKNIDKNMRWIE